MKLIASLLVYLSVASVFAIELKMEHVRIIAPKRNKVQNTIVRKSFHGKVLKSEQNELISTKPVDGNEALQAYTKLIIDKLNSEIMSTIPEISQNLIFRFQIQKSGHFDILNIRSSDQKLVLKMENYLSQIDKFPAIPQSTGQKELQLEFNIPAVIK
ncbi:MAG: hypothetical protein CME65_05110 [Halobacteriovoraceae bacterium]|nr:hypothetical protein [Halobacteriovoraceae bacterium]|tara:strand:- start:16578 stop:17048 length:471 start_codon:yes stop_codon:yes gene_type:complete